VHRDRVLPDRPRPHQLEDLPPQPADRNATRTTSNLVTVCVGDDWEISFVNAVGTVDVVVDVAGYYIEPYASTPPGDTFTSVPTTRTLDTRTAGHSPLGAGPSKVTVAGTAGVPASGVDAVVANVTVTKPTTASFLTVSPGGGTDTGTSSLNFGPGQTKANLVVVALGADGSIDLRNQTGTTDVVIDVLGWYGPTGTGDLFEGITGLRGFDTRVGSGHSGKIGTAAVHVTGGYVPDNATAVVVNVTVTNPTAPSYLTAYPPPGPAPVASTVNFAANQTIANLAVIQVGADGTIDLHNANGSADVVGDIVGYFAPSA